VIDRDGLRPRLRQPAESDAVYAFEIARQSPSAHSRQFMPDRLPARLCGRAATPDWGVMRDYFPALLVTLEQKLAIWRDAS
jgi:hypothetical protein